MRTRLYVVAVLGGMAVLAVATVLVFAFGRYDPSPPSLRDNPRAEIPGEILYVDRDSCFRRVAASGESGQRLACLPNDFFGPVFWLDDGTAGIVRRDSTTPLMYEVDLATGKQSGTGVPVVLDSRPPAQGKFGGAFAPDGAFAFFEDDGGLFLLVDGERIQIASFDLPKFNQPQVVRWSPDSQWILAQYYPRNGDSPELWIISRDGQTKGTLATDAQIGPEGLAAWRIGDAVEPPNPE